MRCYQLPTQLTVSIRLYISNPNLIDDRSNLRLIRSKLTQCNLQLRSYTANHAGTSRSSATYVALRLYPKIGYINIFPELVTGQLAINIHQTIYHIISIYFSPQQAPSIYWSSLSVITYAIILQLGQLAPCSLTTGSIYSWLTI